MKMVKRFTSFFLCMTLVMGLLFNNVAVRASEPVDGWIVNDDETRSYYRDGQKVRDEVVEIDGNGYYFDTTGILMVNNMLPIQLGDREVTYMADPDGVLYRNKWYEENDLRYYFGDDYCRYEDGVYVVDYISYYFDRDGCATTDIDRLYRYDDKGELYRSCWYKDETTNIRYYYRADGIMCHNGVYVIDGKSYYFNYEGHMLRDRELDGYRAKEDGSLYINEWYTDNEGYSYYYDANGQMCSNGVYNIDGKDYYFDKKGRERKDMFLQKTDGSYYTSEWYTDASGNKYYYGADSRKYIDGIYVITGDSGSNDCYCFDDEGVLIVGKEYTVDGEIVRARADGRLYIGEWYTYDDGSKAYYGGNCEKYMDGSYEINDKNCYFYDGVLLERNQYVEYDNSPYMYIHSEGIIVSFDDIGDYSQGKLNVFLICGEYDAIDDFLEAYPEYEDKLFIWEITEYDYEQFVSELSEKDVVSLVCFYGSAVSDGNIDAARFDTLGEIGITEKDYANSYDYALEYGKVNDELKFVSENVCPGVFLYNKDIATAVFGTSDEIEIQKLLDTPDKFYEAAEKIKAAGYTMTGGIDEDFEAAVFADSMEKFCQNEGAGDFVQTLRNKKYTTDSGWQSVELYNEMLTNKVFGIFQQVDSLTNIALPGYTFCQGPINFADNVNAVCYGVRDSEKDEVSADIAEALIRYIISDEDRLYNSFAEDGRFVNNKAVMEKLIKDNVYNYGSCLTIIDSELKGLEPAAAAKQGWIKEDSKVYYYENGEKTLGFAYIDGKWYYFNPDNGGAMITGWKLISGKYYYFNPDGDMVKGWKLINGRYYFFDNNGYMSTGWKLISGKYYFFNPDGDMVKGWKYISGKYYYFNPDGDMVKGWKYISGKYYYFNPAGDMVKGWKYISGKYYFFDNNGYMSTGWKLISGKYYFFNPDGDMVKGWKLIGGKYYFFNPDGDMVTGWKYISGKYYYFNPAGDMVTGWKQIDGKWYYFNAGGDMVTGVVKIGNRYYRFNSSGAWLG